MGFFKCLGYVAAGVGAVVLIPATGGSSLALAIGALGTTTAAGAAIGAGVGAAAAAIDHAASSHGDGYRSGFAEGVKSGEKVAQSKYETKISALVERLQSYHDLDKKILGLYAVGLAVANADGYICPQERQELDAFIAGCSAGNLPLHIKESITKLSNNPPTLEHALGFAIKADLSKQDIQDVIDVVAMADGTICEHEKAFIASWEAMATELQIA